MNSIWRTSFPRGMGRVARFARGKRHAPVLVSPLHTSAWNLAVKPYLLADVGEGITECRVTKWFVKPGDRVEQFDPVCEVQSDKASVEITSRYDGVISAVHYEEEEMAIVGEPLLDIDIEEDESVDVPEISPTSANEDTKQPVSSESRTSSTAEDQPQDKIVPLTPTEKHMFKVMTQSLSIPHFGYTHYVDLTATNEAKSRLNARRSNQQPAESLPPAAKVTALPFIMKAISDTFLNHERLNAHLDTWSDPNKPQLVVKASHDFGFAVDTPRGLLVPVVKNVQDLSVASISEEINRLSGLARNGRLLPADLDGPTFTVSNIGAIGGHVVNPIIMHPTVAIVAIGRTQMIPQVEKDGNMADKAKAVLSWSADHRILDGATVARCAEAVNGLLQDNEWYKKV